MNPLRRWLAITGLVVGALLVCTGSAQPQQKAKGLPGEKFTPPAPGERQPDRFQVGDPAPDFTLPDPSGKKEITLSTFRGKKPVVLIFGSCT